jgi:hypothetical protein
MGKGRLASVETVIAGWSAPERDRVQTPARRQLALSRTRRSSVALGVGKVEGDLIGELCSGSSVGAAGVSVCRVPVPAVRHRAGRAVVPALHSLNSRLVRSWLAVLGSCGRFAPAGVDHGLGEDGDVAGVQPGDSVAEVDG